MKKRKEVSVSPSQAKTYKECQRKWGIEKVLRWPKLEKNKTATVFGSVLHEVAERWLLADERGLDPATGQPVELYPKGWTKTYNKWTGDLDGEISTKEAGIVQVLVERAIEGRVLVRREHRQIEKKVERVLSAAADLPCPLLCEGELDCVCDGGRVPSPVAKLLGFVDVAIMDPVQPEIQDHKTSGSRRYLLNQEKLANDLQILTYAYEVLCELEDESGVPDNVVLRHNQFVRDPKDLYIRKVDVTVTSEHVKAFREVKFLPLVREMQAWHGLANKIGKDLKFDMFPAPLTEDPCYAYGGCPYKEACYYTPPEGSEGDAEAHYLGSYALKSGNRESQKDLVMSTKAMGILSKLGKVKKKAKKKAEPAPPAEPELDEDGEEILDEPPVMSTPDDDVEVDEPTPSTDADTKAPWACPKCVSCKNNEVPGISSKGDICRICDAVNKNRGRPTSADFDVGYDGSSVVWTGPDGEKGSIPYGGPVRLKDLTNTGKVVGDPKAELPAPAQEAPAEEGTVDEANAPEPPAKKKKTKKKKTTKKKAVKEAAPAKEEAVSAADEALAERTAKDSVTVAEKSGLTERSVAEHVATLLGTDRYSELAESVKSARSKTGRRKRTLRLLINVAVECSTGDRPLMLARILRELKSAAEIKTQTPWHCMPYFERRDSLLVAVPVVAEICSGRTLICRTEGQEEKEFVDELRAYASDVFRGA